jgi:hypothetical protein
MGGNVDQNIKDQVSESYDCLLFVIDQDGNFVVPRADQDKDLAENWMRYQKKLIYEMKKKRRGWIFYPDETMAQGNHARRVIRYLPAQKEGWIIALEGSSDSPWGSFSQILDKKILYQLMGIIFLGFLGMQFMTRWMFLIAERELKDILERQYVGMNNEMIRNIRQKKREFFTDEVHKEMQKLDQFHQNVILKSSSLPEKAPEEVPQKARVEMPTTPIRPVFKKKKFHKKQLYFDNLADEVVRH